MKRTSFILLTLFALLWWVAARQPSFGTQDLRKPLEPTSSESVNIAPTEKYLKSAIEDFLAGGFREALKLPASDSLRLLSLRKDKRGGRHARTQQLHYGVPIFGAWYNLHEKNGIITSTNGTVFQTLKVNMNPVLEEADAFEKAIVALPASRYAWQDEHFELALRHQKRDTTATYYPKGELIVVPKQLFPEAGTKPNGEEQPVAENIFRLAWRFDIFGIEPELKREHIFVDAIDGSVLHRLSQIAHCHTPSQGRAAYRPELEDIATDSCNTPATPKYRLHDVLRNIEIFDARNTTGTPPFSFFNDTTLWVPPYPQADTVAIAAMHGLEIWYDYFSDKHGWHGLDGLGEYPIHAWVHHGNNYENAFYDGFLHFGDGNPNAIWRTPLVSRDIVAHEATHGVIGHTSHLLHVYEPGIINEAIADIFACLVELEQGDGNWMLGEDIRTGGNRRLDVPNSLQLPDTYKGSFWINQHAPQEGLHHNSTVLGHWFYLLSEGGASVTAIGRHKAANLLFHTLCYFLNPNDGFFAARRATMQAAWNLDWSLDEIDNLAMAWCAIGVGGCEAQGNESITLISPNGGEEFFPGDTIQVAWENTPGVTAVTITLSINNGASWQSIDSFLVFGTTGSRFVVAPNVNSRLCRMKILAPNDPLAFDDSDGVFAIIGCSLLSRFMVTPESGCYGTSFTFNNTTHESNAEFSWIVDGQVYDTVPDSGFSLPNLEPGLHTVALIAKEGVCIDTFSRTIQVAPIPSATFNISVSNYIVTAEAVFSSGEQYYWSIDGQNLGDFDGSEIINWTAPGAGAFELCLFVVDNCSIGGEKICQTVLIEEEEHCEGNVKSWEQFSYTNNAKAIAEKGDTLYIATSGGLIELYDKDSGSFNLYTPTNSGLHALPLTSVAVRNDGTVIVGTQRCGLALFDGENWNVITTSTWPSWLLSDMILKMERNESGDIWIMQSLGPAEVITKWGADNTYSNYLEEYGIYDFAYSGNDLFVSTNQGMKKITEQGDIEDINHPAFPNGFGPIAATDSILWMIESSSVVLGFNFHTGELQYYDFLFPSYPGPNPPPTTYITIAYVDNEGYVWVGTNDQAYRSDGVNIDAFGPSEGLTEAVNLFFQDSDGIIWGGTNKGLFRFNDPGWELIDLSTNGLLHYPMYLYSFYSDDVWDMELAPDGQMYVTYSSELIEKSTSGWTVISCDGSLSPNGQVAIDTLNNVWTNGFMYSTSNTCLSYEQLNYPGTNINSMASWGKYMCFTSNSGLHLYDVFTDEWSLFEAEFLYSLPRLNEPGPDGSLWFTEYGDTLVELTSDMQVVFHYPPSDFPNVYNYSSFGIAAPGKSGNVWLSFRSGHDNYQLVRYNKTNGTWTIMETYDNAMGIIARTIYDLKIAPNNIIWIGNSAKGVIRFDPILDSVEVFNSCNSGLPGNTVFSIEFDDEGRVWAATNNGIGILSYELIQPSFLHQESVCYDVTTIFTNTTTGAASWEWRVDGDLISTERDLEYLFSTPGNSIVELTAFNAEGCGVSTSQAIKVYPAADLSGFPENITGCSAFYQLCAPEGMSAYEWKKEGNIVGTDECLNIEQNDSSVYLLKIMDSCGNTDSATVTVMLSGTCVYPGDLNNDGIVDYRDLLWLGHTFGYSGPARTEQGISWRAYLALDWHGHLPNSTSTNFKYCDADGSGFIDLLDWDAIDLNYLNTHGTHPGLPVQAQSPYSFVPYLVEIDTSLGDKKYRVIMDIIFQDASGLGINNIYGAGMRIYFELPEGVELVGTPEFSFNNSSLGMEGVDAIRLVKPVLDQGLVDFVDVAFTRIDHLNPSSVDVLGSVDFIVVDDHLPIFDSVKFTLNLIGNTAITNIGDFIPISGTEYTFTGSQITDTKESASGNQISIYPNPTAGHCRISIGPKPAREAAIQVLNMHGTEVWAASINGQASIYNLDLSSLPAGLYLAIITTGQGRQVRKIVKI